MSQKGEAELQFLVMKGFTKFWFGVAVAALGLVGQQGPASADTWLCPECGETTVERAPDDPVLDCGECGTFTIEDLSWIVGYLNYKTRPAETSFVVLPEECDRFRQDGLLAYTPEHAQVWVPWVMVDWFIPRQRILKLVDGREFTTDYARTRGGDCPLPPKFLFELADTIRVEGAADRISSKSIDEDISTLFVIAGSPEGLHAGVARFIREVEAGNHPRLPRTDCQVVNPRIPQIPVTWRGKTMNHKVVVKIRSDGGRQLLEMKLIKSCGDAALDQAALSAARTSALGTAGEMGVGVPSSVLFHYDFKGDSCTVEAEIPKNSIWDN